MSSDSHLSTTGYWLKAHDSTSVSDPTVRTEMRRSLKPAAASKVRAGELLVKYDYDLVIWDDGVPRLAVEVFEEALRYWHELLREWGFEEARFIDRQPTEQRYLDG